MRIFTHNELSPLAFTGAVTSSCMMPSKLLACCLCLTSTGTLFLTSGGFVKLPIKITLHDKKYKKVNYLSSFIILFCLNLFFDMFS